MKIVIFGNTNNYPLRLAEGFRMLGHDAHLIVDNTALLHRPEALHPEYASGYPYWIHDMSDLNENDYIGPTPRLSKVIAQLEEGDGIVLNSWGPSLLAHLSRPTVSLLTGSDLDFYADYRSLEARQCGWDAEYRKTVAAQFDANLWRGFVDRQRSGILNSRGVSFFRRRVMPSGDAILDSIGVRDAQRFMVYMADSFDNESFSTDTHAIPRIFYGARVSWLASEHRAGLSPLDCKGTEIAIGGMVEYIQKTGKPLDIRIVKKGPDIKKTQELISRCGISRYVTWLEEMNLKDFFTEIEQADICFDQLGGLTIGMVGLDAMAMGKPLIADARPDIWTDWPEAWPVCHAGSGEDVCRQLMHLIDDVEYRAEVGRKSKDFVNRYFSPEKNAELVLGYLFPEQNALERLEEQ